MSSKSDEHGAQLQTLITRDPGGAFVQAEPPATSGSEQVLAAGDNPLSGSGVHDAPAFMAIDDAGHTGALVVPAASATVAVVHYDGAHWTREQICTNTWVRPALTAPSGLKVLAIAASSPQNAWMLASSNGEPLMLFKRTPAASGAPVWVRDQPASWAPAAQDQVFARERRSDVDRHQPGRRG